jgi:MinD superfamily P-loop ATPase
MKELVVIGGTGKTSVIASLATLAGRCVLADCDVDAADLHLIFEPKVIRREDFIGGCKARIRPGRCTACGKCEELCRFNAIYFDGPCNGRVQQTYRIETTACEGCGVCVDYCALGAIEFAPAVCGRWFVSETRCGPMVHAELGIAAENSGKLVTQIRRTAQEVAYGQGLELVLCDGSPGIGCPVIASLTGASLALYIVEPTVSGIHDFRRVAQLAARLDVPGLLVVNKADLNEEIAEEIEAAAVKHGIDLAGRIPYDQDVTRAQIARKTVVEFSDGPASQAIHVVWAEIQKHLQSVAVSTIDGLVQIQPLSPIRN